MFSWVLNHRQLGDFELIATGACAPLEGFMTKEQYESVVHTLYLPSGELFSMPMVLDIPEVLALKLKPGDSLCLQSPTKDLLGEMEVSDVWKMDKNVEAELVYGSTSMAHSGVVSLFNDVHNYYVGGKFTQVFPYLHFGFREHFLSPLAMKELLKERSSAYVVAFHTRNPIHRAHWKICEHAIEEHGALLLLHPVVGSCQPDDVDFATRMRCYRHVLKESNGLAAILAVCPIVMRMAGPREALWHAMIRRNYGVSHFIVGRDHASPTGFSQAYGTYEAQDICQSHEKELGLEIVRAKEYVYCPQTHHFVEKHKLASTVKTETLSGSRIRDLLRSGAPVPDWLTFPLVHNELRYRYSAGLGRGHVIIVVGEEGDLTSLVARGVREVLLEQARQGVCLCPGSYLDLTQESGEVGKQSFLNFFVQSLIQVHGILIIYDLLPRHYQSIADFAPHLWSSCLVVHLFPLGTKGCMPSDPPDGFPMGLPVPEDNYFTIEESDPLSCVNATIQWLVYRNLLG